MLQPGAVVAGYRVERVLGTGGMGVVYLVANPELPRRDALKVLSPELSKDPDFRARFTREADVASMLDHPNITSIYRRGTTEDDQLWIAMQFVDGTDADQALRAGTMTPRRALHIITEVGKALDYAHEQHVVHRDVKPANFLLSGPVGPRERVLLADFGIARALDDSAITVTGSVTATLAYAAPEVISGGQVDGRSDIYSLGCAFFRLLTGKAPYYNAPSAAGVMNAHLRQPPPRVSVEMPRLPTALDAVIATAMAKDPGLRYGTAADFCAAAAAALTDESTVPAPRRITAPPPPIGPPPSGPWQPYQQFGTPPSVPHVVPPGRRSRAKVIGAVGGVIALVAATVVGVTVYANRDDESEPIAADTTTTSTTETTGTPGTTTTTRPLGPPVAAAALPGLLSNPTEVANLVGAGGITVTQTGQVLSDDTAVVDNLDCLGAMSPAQRVLYTDSGYTAVYQELSRSANDGPPTHSVTQAVISFPDAAAATRLVDKQTELFNKCADKSVSATVGQPPQTARFTFGSPSTTDGVLTTLETREGGNGWACDRALTARNNVVADVMVCRYDPAGQAVALARAIRDRIP